MLADHLENMISFENINAIAKYERRILLRSWFFRIFAILSLLVIGIYGAAITFDSNPFTWVFRSLPSALIYSNMFLLNIFQSIIAVFLATDFLKRDKKLNTSEVLFIRPMSNTEYVLGKTLGLLWVFILLNLLVILLTSIYQLISSQVAFQVLPLLYYFVLVSIPTLIFIIGLSYALMIIIKNQPIVFIILLGYIALILFYLGEKMGYIFDYMVFVMPMAYSDIVGFTGLSHILMHRATYLIFGIGLISFTTWRLNRLPNIKQSNITLSVVSVVLLAISAYGFYSLVNEDKTLKAERALYTQTCKNYYNVTVPEMTRASITFEFGKEALAKSVMTLENKTESNIDTLYFSINPGFRVQSVKANETDLKFIQENLLVKVIPSSTMQPGDREVIEMNYSGIPDFNIAYLDNKDEEVFGYDRVMTMRINRDYGFYTNNYVLLTKENLWYPVPGITYDPTRPAIFRQQFTKFDLTVVAADGLMPVSQGMRTTEDSATYHFRPRDPLPQLSLTIGNFVEKSVDIGGIKVNLNHLESHNYYEESLSEIGDTAVALITEFLDDFERPMNMYYPYAEFSLVEVPAQFASHPHSWTSTLAESQPGMVFLPEGGFNVMQADFKSNFKRTKRNSERNKEGLTDKEIQASVFTNFLKGVFAAEESGFRFGPQEATNTSNPYSIFPNYYYYVNYITSSECPVLNYAFESYLMKGEDDPRMMFMSRMTGIGDNEKANIKLKEKSLKQIIAEEEDQEVINRVLGVKGAYLLTWMEKQINNPDFEKFLLDYLYDNSFREITYRELAESLSNRFNIELGGFIDDWYNANKLPAFVVGSYQVFEVIDQSQAKFVVKTKVTNFSDVGGMVKFTFQLGGGNRGGGGPGFFGMNNNMPDPEERIYLIEANQTKELQMVISDAPRSVIFNTLISENIPTSSMQFGLDAQKDEKIKAVEYERESDEPVALFTEGELICDNTDPGFSTIDPSLENPLRKFVDSRKKKESDSEFVGQGWGPGPSTWSLNANSEYFGKTEHSAMMVRSGDGGKTATWTKKLPKEGYYDVYVYLQRQRGFGGPPGRGGGRRDPEGKFVYTVPHEDGVEEIELELKDFEDGWNLLGSFYIASEEASVTLSDKGGADRVVADAVKWVLQR